MGPRVHPGDRLGGRWHVPRRAAPPDAIERLTDVSRARTTATGAATLSQVAAVAALTNAGPWLAAFRAHLREMLLEHARVAVVPGTARWLGAGAEGHIRISFATSKAIMSDALDRVTESLTRLIQSGW